MICWALGGNRPAWSDHTRWALTGHWPPLWVCHCSRFLQLTFRSRSAGNPCQRRSLFGPKSEPGLPEKYSNKWDFTFAKLMANCASNCCPEKISLTLYQVMRKSKWTLFTFLRALFYIQYQWGLIIWKPFSATKKKNWKGYCNFFFSEL